MTEAEWLAAPDPGKLVHLLVGSGSERKLRHAACACCRTIQNRYYLPEAKAALNHCEQYADEFNNVSAREEMIRLGSELFPYTHLRSWIAEEGAALRALGNAVQVCNDVVIYRQYVCFVGMELLYPSNILRRVQLFRVLSCVFGDPSRPVSFDPSWRTEAAIALARGMYESRDFGPMPVLADALDDAGCGDGDVLAHCRGPGPHARGCWVVDLVLGKS